MLKSQAKVKKTGSETDSKSAQKVTFSTSKTWSNQSVFIKKVEIYRKSSLFLLCAFVTPKTHFFAKVFFLWEPLFGHPISHYTAQMDLKKDDL
jgi:hypothetical protein